MKRFISANASEILAMDAKELKESIKASEGRVILSENVAVRDSFIGDITNAEIARAFGADLILLNAVDVLNPNLFAIKDQKDFINELKTLVKRPIGVNLEPVDDETNLMDEKIDISEGRKASETTLRELERLGADFVCLTGNPGTGVTNEQIEKVIKNTKKYFSGLIIAGKMHSSGVDEPIITKEVVKKFLDAGSDIILVPAVGTVPGFNSDQLTEIVQYTHAHGGLVMSSIGTSQESSGVETIRRIAIDNKICGVDIQHIGDAGYGGVAPYENIFELSKAIRGVRHTVSRVARSINR